MKTKCLIIISLICCILVFISSFGVTNAYLVNKQQKTNILTVGELKIKIDEEYNPPSEIIPGLSFNKKPYATNTGNVPCTLRARVIFSDSVAGEPNNMGGFCHLDYNTNYWEYNEEDDFWYYIDVNTKEPIILNPGESCINNALFTTVTIDENISQNNIIPFQLSIYMEALQIQ